MRTAPLRVEGRNRRISATTLYSWADQGLIRTLLIGKRRHIDLDSLDDYLERLIAEQAGGKLPGPRRERVKRPPPKPYQRRSPARLAR